MKLCLKNYSVYLLIICVTIRKCGLFFFNKYRMQLEFLFDIDMPDNQYVLREKPAGKETVEKIARINSFKWIKIETSAVSFQK